MQDNPVHALATTDQEGAETGCKHGHQHVVHLRMVCMGHTLHGSEVAAHNAKSPVPADRMGVQTRLRRTSLGERLSHCRQAAAYLGDGRLGMREFAQRVVGLRQTTAEVVF
jgi:hypothetical protein